MDKYYTPSIEEFHVGFEYECVLPQWIEQEWRSTIVGTNEDLDAINELINLDRCRVKYLDQEDIESFGFKKYKKHLMSGYNEAFMWEHPNLRNPKKGENTFFGATININYETGRCLIWFGHWNSFVSNTVFRGVIKNKSELKKLLKQIGVIKEDGNKEN